MFGKIVDYKLVLAGNKIQTPFGVIINPKEKDYLDNGWKEVKYAEKPTYNDEEEKLIEVYVEEINHISVEYKKVDLTNEEHNEVIKNKILNEEVKIDIRQYREGIIDLKDGKKSSYALDKIDEINSNIEILRAKLIK